jgi:lantibiotic duramycin-like protein
VSPKTILRQAAADAELREELLATPERFGVPAEAVPAGVEPLDAEALDFWTEGVATTDIYACASSCSWGPFTIVCDGTTKVQ